MVHRDIKPSNLMLARQGTRPVVKILDFGLAKATQEGPIDAGLTREGQMLGTPDYIAPEQSLNAQKADIRADIYSLGCTFYCLLTGRPPFTANSLFELLQAHHSRDAAPLNLARPDVPATLAALVARMMAKDPASRFQNPGEVAQAIKPFLKPGEFKAEPTQAARAVANPVTPANPPQTATTAAPAGNVAKAAQPATAWDAIDRGQEASLSRPESALHPVGARGTPWLWPSVGAGALVLGLALAWTFGLAPKSKDGQGEPPAIVGASRSDPGAARTPSDAAPPVRSEPMPPIAPVKQPEPVKVAQVATAPQAPTPAVVPEPPVRKPSPTVTKAARKGRPVEARKKAVAEPVLDFRHLPIHPAVDRLVNAGREPPRGGIWPTLTADNTRSWQFGDPDLIEINGKALALSAGPNGNLLVTRRDDYVSGTLTINMTATKGTEAFLALRAHPGPDGWQAITLRVKEEGGKVRVDHPSLDFQPPKDGAKAMDFDLGRAVSLKFEIHGDDNVARVAIRQEKWELSCKTRPASEYAGSIGLFVKTGTIRVSKLNVQESGRHLT
jgi:hypothetical protein